ncbi:MAG TPA: VOC family protein [Solirubrobacteraceae bacterium]|nr:VOC family protein [Solirubrobacteraceae bacterium]
MGERTKYTPGTFSWTDLATTDQDAAKEFYGQLFGWTAVDYPVGEGVVYSMMQIDGKDVAAISLQPQQQADAGVPPLWNSYVTVESADATADRAQKLGATVHAPPFDVMDAGRMAVIQDPQGAFFMPWEPKDHNGASLVNASGALSWNELASVDPEASAQFYRELFGWKVEQFQGMEMTYLGIQNAAGHSNGGIREAMENEPSYWLVYFGTADADADTARATELGANTLAPPMDISVGRIAVLQDPQGAVFALYAGTFDE